MGVASAETTGHALNYNKLVSKDTSVRKDYIPSAFKVYIVMGVVYAHERSYNEAHPAAAVWLRADGSG